MSSRTLLSTFGLVNAWLATAGMMIAVFAHHRVPRADWQDNICTVAVYAVLSIACTLAGRESA